MKVLFIVNHEIVIYNFRKELVEKLVESNVNVTISCPYGKKLEFFRNIGCSISDAPISRHGMNPFYELHTYQHYKELLLKEKPDVVLTYTIKPNVYAGYICGRNHIPYIANVTGLGGSIENNSILQRISIFLYKRGLLNAECVFFQNESNLRFMQKKKIINEQYRLIPGSGVNIKEHSFEEYPLQESDINFLYIGRIMRDKGVSELVEAAKRIKKKYSNVNFTAIGFCEDEFRTEIEKTDADKYIELLGQKDDVHSYIKKAHAVILPSYHEGMANVLLEAASSGRPVLASRIPGCMETFDEGESGIGFEPRNIESLCNAIEQFINLPYEMKVEMGRKGRIKMEQQFNREIIVKAYMDEIEKIKDARGI